MKKVALIFMLAVFAPSLVLAWLATRSVRDQQLVLERQRALLYEGVAEAMAKDVAGYIAGQQRDFAEAVRKLRWERSSVDVANHFDEYLRAAWPMAEVGFAVTLDGNVYSPSLFGRPEARTFRLENDRFLCSREAAEVYFNTGKGLIPMSKLEEKAPALSAKRESSSGNDQTTNAGTAKMFPGEFAAPRIESGEAEFRQLVADESDGIVARYLQNKLKLLVWHRTNPERDVVYGAQLDLAKTIAGIEDLVRVPESVRGQVLIGLLDDMDRLVNGAVAARGAPFVTAEIGAVLPHWKVAVYLADPDAINKAAGTLRWTLGLIVIVMMAAIAIGSVLIVADVRRQLMLSRQKTDFVSNVSHELKTPLTSIRMFSELLAEDRVDGAAQRKQFLGIITAEAARLTRLINNVLDFARVERGEKKYCFARCDLRDVVRDTVESYRPQLEAAGFVVSLRLPAEELPLNADCDALAQVIVNLLSNAEKYAAAGKEIAVELERGASGRPAGADDASARRNNGVPVAHIRVCDRGPGVPRGAAEKIFEQFYRAHDSLSSGIQGSGLGLTLARQVARAHGGDVKHAPREGGGSCFTVELPLNVKEP